MNAKKIKSTVIASALVGCLAIGGISAYFTDADTAKNEFTVGKVSIDLQEPSFTEEDTEGLKEITPGMEIKKDPKIVNTGKNEAYGFLKVVVPYASVVTADEEGNADATASYKELFTYEVNDGWVELDGKKVVDEANGIVTHIYAYGSGTAMTAIGDSDDADNTTAALFNEVKLINLVEGNLEETPLTIDVTAYAIQTSNLGDAVDAGDLDSEDMDGVNSDVITAPDEIWDIVVNANPSTTQAAEDAETDIIQ